MDRESLRLAKLRLRDLQSRPHSALNEAIMGILRRQILRLTENVSTRFRDSPHLRAPMSTLDSNFPSGPSSTRHSRKQNSRSDQCTDDDDDEIEELLTKLKSLHLNEPSSSSPSQFSSPPSRRSSYLPQSRLSTPSVNDSFSSEHFTETLPQMSTDIARRHRRNSMQRLIDENRTSQTPFAREVRNVTSLSDAVSVSEQAHPAFTRNRARQVRLYESLPVDNIDHNDTGFRHHQDLHRSLGPHLTRYR